MAASLKLSISVTGLNELRAKLKLEPLAGEAWTAAMGEMVRAGLSSVTAASPSHAAAYSSRVQSIPVPRYGVVKMVRLNKRYNVAAWLEYAPKSPYRNFFLGAMLKIKGTIAAALESAARAIEKKWAS